MTYNSLNSKYFERMHDDGDYITYATKGEPLVLFSEIDGIALASIHFKPSSRHNAKIDSDVKSLIIQYPNPYPYPYPNQNDGSTQRFQGLINKSDQEFEYVITNLSTKGSIIFNLNDQNLDSKRINQINVLNPNQSCIIRCNKTNNLPFILQKFKNEKNEVMTVENDEEYKEPNGVNILLSVVPQRDVQELVNRFEKTVWRIADFVTTTTPIKRETCMPNNSLNMWDPYDIGTIKPIMNIEFDILCNDEIRKMSAFSGTNGIGICDLYDEPVKGGVIDSRMGCAHDDSWYSTRNDDIVKKSYLGKIAYGKETLEVKSSGVNCTFDYTKKCRPCVLGLSISDDNEIFFVDVEVVVSIEEAKFIKNNL